MSQFQTKISSTQLIGFVCALGLLLVIGLYTDSYSAVVFFWIGVGILIARVTLSDLRRTLLAYWTAASFGILGHLSSGKFRIQDFQVFNGVQDILALALYTLAFVAILHAIHRSFGLLISDKQSEQKEPQS